MDTHRNILFGVLALQADLIDPTQFAEICDEWSGKQDRPLADMLVERGWITPVDRQDIERRLERKLHKNGGDSLASLATMADDDIRAVLSQISDTLGLSTLGGEPRQGEDDPLATLAQTGIGAEFQPTLDAPSPSQTGGHVLVSSISYRPETNERYTLTRLHAKGGIGQVWLARDADLGRQVALKVLRPERAANPQIWARFLEEARITGQLEHPGIVPVYELARSPDRQPFYTMRFVQGRTLSQAIEAYHHKRQAGQAGPLDLLTLLTAFVGVCNAVAYAHARGVIHRDLKGQNVMLGEYGEAMVLDWGLAKVVDRPEGQAEAEAPGIVPGPDEPAGRTIEGQALGTPAYMAPEQAAGRNDKIGRRTDVYGLGSILYEILTGAPPFTGSNTTEVLRKVVNETPRRPRLVNAEAPAALEAVCLRAIAKRPEDRYASASDLAGEVQRWLADEPVQAYRDPLTKRLSRWAKRHKTAVAAASVLVVTTVAALAFGTVLVTRERNEARLQRQQARRAVDEMYTEVAVKWLEDRLDPLQRQFLEKALAHYEQFAGQATDEPAVRQERGRAYHRMGDILRKLGRDADAEKAYRRALEILGNLVAEFPQGVEHLHHWANTHHRLGVTLTSQGAFPEAESLFRNALGVQEKLVSGRDAPPEHRLSLAKTHKGLADLLRVNGRSKDAEQSYRRAVDLNETLVGAAPGETEPRVDLAAAYDKLGLLLKETSQPRDAEKAYRRALQIQEALAAEFPTLPSHREGLATSLNSLGLLLEENGRPQDAEQSLRRAVEVSERLAGDFPLRPEFRRGLAKSRVNLGNFLEAQGRVPVAEQELRKAAELYERLAVESPAVLQYRLDLARTHSNLGKLLKSTRELAEAEKSYRRAREINEKLAAEFPTVPGYRQALAGSLSNLASLLGATNRAKDAEAAYRRSVELYEKLAAEFPDKPEYRKGLAQSLYNLGNLLRNVQRAQDAEPAYRRSLELYEKLAAELPGVPDHRQALAQSLNALAALLKETGRTAEAEPVYRRSVEINEKLAADFPSQPAYRHKLAIVLNNLGELLDADGHDAGAEQAYRRARELLEKLATDSPAVTDYQAHLSYVLGNQGRLQLKRKKAAEARPLLERAARLQEAILETNPKNSGYRSSLRDLDLALAVSHIELGEHDQAAKVAAELPRIEPDRPESRYDAARLLARCASLAEGDSGLPEERRKAVAWGYADRAVALLREAIDGGFQGSDRIKGDTDLDSLRSRDDFRRLTGLPGGPEKPKAE